MNSQTEREVAAFLEAHVAKLAPLNTASADAYWRATTGGGQQAEAEYARLRRELMELYSNREQFARIKAWRASGEVTDPLLARQLDLLYNDFLGNQLPPETIAELVRRETEIESIFTNFRAQYQGRRVSDNEITAVLQDENDNRLRREAWEASKQIGREVAPKLIELAEFRNRVARDLGFRNYHEMALTQQEIDPTELFATLGELERQTTEPFRKAKAKLDQSLAERFGVAAADLRPWHYADPFFQDAPATGEVDLDRYFRGKDIPSLVQGFYRDLELDVADIIARSDLYEREGKYQHAYCTDIDRQGDVRVLCNIKDNEQWTSTLLHELGHAVYDKYSDPGLPYLLRTPAHISSTEAIAMMMGALAENARWLETYAGATRAEAAAAAAAVADKLTLSMLIFVRWGLVMVYFERALYDNPRQDLNRLWWDLVQRLQLLAPPEGRNEPDYAAKIHLGTAPVYYQNYILGELTAAQIRTALAREVSGAAGAAAAGSAGPAGEGALADVLVQNPAAGRYLVERIFRYGSRGTWNDMLRHATGEPLNPRHFVDQFVGG